MSSLKWCPIEILLKDYNITSIQVPWRNALSPFMILTWLNLSLLLGWSSRISVRFVSLSFCGAVPGLADVGKAMEGFPEAIWHCSLPFLMWPSALDWQHCSHIWLPRWTSAVLYFPSICRIWHLRQVPQTSSYFIVVAYIFGVGVLTYCLVLHLPHKLALARASHLLALYQQVLWTLWHWSCGTLALFLCRLKLSPRTARERKLNPNK